jgi:hypothetical protein
MKLKKSLKFSLLFSIIIYQQSIWGISLETQQELWSYSMETYFNRTIDLFEYFNATPGYRQRQNYYLGISNVSDGLYAQSAHIYSNVSINEEKMIEGLEKIYDYEDTMDFRIQGYVRMLYLNINKTILNGTTKNKVIDALGRCKYWYTEKGRIDSAIYTTENHQILYHSSEYLLGQLFPNNTFPNSGMTGKEHEEHALPLVKRWLDWRGQFGFSEWHSNTYYVEDIAPLVNLVDFAMNPEIVTKAAMVLDLMAFDFAINYYKNVYATTMGRAYDGSRIKEDDKGYASDSCKEAAWLMVGVGDTPTETSDMAAVALATSDHYAPPPVLEAIANNASQYFEGYERNNLAISEGPEYGLDYLESGDLMYWWGLSGQIAPETIEQSYYLVEEYKRDPMSAFGPQILLDAFKWLAFFHGKSLKDYSEEISEISRGLLLEKANIYTYRTPYYQLAGAQDHKKGENGGQELIWQATLDNQAYVLTNSPGGYTQQLKQMYMGGWKPKATLYKNVGIIQYDREVMPFELEVGFFFLNLFTGFKFYTHAYFPKWAFDSVVEYGKWMIGKKGDGYVALYTYEPSFWVNNYELRSWGQKNAYIVELGSVEEHGSFDNFVEKIRQASVSITPQSLGYIIQYSSPSRGAVSVRWEGPMNVAGTNVDTGPYKRFDNAYCQQEFGTSITNIQFNSTRLLLNFNNETRLYQKF